MPSNIPFQHPVFQRLLKSPYGQKLIRLAKDPDEPLSEMLGPGWGPKIKREIYDFDLTRPELGIPKSLAKAVTEKFGDYLVWLSVMEKGKRGDKAKRQRLGPRRRFSANKAKVDLYIRHLIVGDDDQTFLVDDLMEQGFSTWSKPLQKAVPSSKIKELSALLEEGYDFDTDAAFEILAPYASNPDLLSSGKQDLWLELFEESQDT